MQFELDLHGKPREPERPPILTVAEVTRRVRELLEGHLGEIWVEGEISNLRRQASGHQYFTLKDATSQLSCVLFSSAARSAGRLTDGQQVQVFGNVSVYEPRGQYQLVVRLVQDRGAGALQARFEALKRQLAEEGLFDAARKRPLPRFPACVGVVTSPTGAAIRDFLNVLHRRHPGIHVVINPVRVQGRGAAAEIARAVEEFGQWKSYGLPRVDVIVVTRGGGSLEDLWEFNEEIVARAIAASPIPVVSAVGHEIDFTISDFAADLRAPTPSAAAELLAADRLAVLDRLRQQEARLAGLARGRVDLIRARLAAVRQSPLFREPARRLQEYRQTLDRLGEGLTGGAERLLERRRNALAAAWHRLSARSPAQALRDVRHAAALHQQRLGEITRRKLADLRSRCDQHSATLRALNPDATLARGFTITLDATGKPVVSAQAVRPGAQLRTRFADGTVDSTAD